MVINTACYMTDAAARVEAIFYTHLRETTLDILTGLPGYDSWNLETKNSLYDLIKCDILKAFNK